jgi:integrase
MANPSYLKLRGRTWSFRLKIPQDVLPLINEEHSHYGKTEILYSLKTKDVDVAKSLRWKHRAYWQEEFERIKASASYTISTDQKKLFDDTLKELEAYKTEYEFLNFSPTVAEVREEMKLYEASGQPYPKHLKTQIAALDYHRSTIIDRKEAAIPSEFMTPFSVLAAEYLKEREGGIMRQTHAEKRTSFRLFQEHIEDKPLASVRMKDVDSFAKSLKKVDANWGRWKDRKDLTLKAAIARSAGAESCLTNKTVNKHLSNLRSLWKWARKREDVHGSNPFEDMDLPPNKSEEKTYLSYTIEELNTLFATPTNRLWLWEIALVGLYTGMRQSEIASLEWHDIRQENGIWFIDITKAKSDAGVRIVPIHDDLEWLISRKLQRSTGRLWPNLRPQGPDGRLAQYVSKEFGKLRQKRGLVRTSAPGVPRGRLSFHSFRKNVTDCFRHAGIPETDAAEIIGHEKTGITYRVYNPEGMKMEQRKEIVDKIQYDGFEIDWKDRLFQ